MVLMLLDGRTVCPKRILNGGTMLSPTTDAEIEYVTAEVLATIRGQEAIERITIVRAYRYLAEKYPDRTDYADSLAKAVRDLSGLVQRSGTVALAVAVEALFNSIVRDRSSPAVAISAAGTR